MLQVALVTLGRHIGLLNNWYCQPEETEVSVDTYYLFNSSNRANLPDPHRLRPFSFVNIPDWYYIYL